MITKSKLITACSMSWNWFNYKDGVKDANLEIKFDDMEFEKFKQFLQDKNIKTRSEKEFLKDLLEYLDLE